MLIQGLPASAATWRVDGQEWTTLHELLAVNAEVADTWGVANARLSGAAKALKGYTPLRIPRPGDEEKKAAEVDRVVTDPAEIARFFG